MEYSIFPWIGTGEDAPAGSVQQPAPTAFLNRLFQSLNRVLVHLHRVLGLFRIGLLESLAAGVSPWGSGASVGRGCRQGMAICMEGRGGIEQGYAPMNKPKLAADRRLLGDFYEGVAQLKSTVWQAHLTHARSICHAALHDWSTEVHGSCTQHAMRPRMHAMPCHAGLHACNAAMHTRCAPHACVHALQCMWRQPSRGGWSHSMPRAPHRHLSFFDAAVRLACMHACWCVRDCKPFCRAIGVMGIFCRRHTPTRASGAANVALLRWAAGNGWKG